MEGTVGNTLVRGERKPGQTKRRNAAMPEQNVEIRNNGQTKSARNGKGFTGAKPGQ